MIPYDSYRGEAGRSQGAAADQCSDLFRYNLEDDYDVVVYYTWLLICDVTNPQYIVINISMIYMKKYPKKNMVFLILLSSFIDCEGGAMDEHLIQRMTKAPVFRLQIFADQTSCCNLLFIATWVLLPAVGGPWHSARCESQ